MIRPGTPADAGAIADLHTASWQQTYRRLMPDAYLDGVLPGQMRERWANRLADPPGGTILLVAQGSSMTGFFYGMAGTKPHDFLIDNLHVHADHQGTGLGTRLMRAGITEAVEKGFLTAHLKVLQGNDRAVTFYRRLGGVTCPKEQDDFPGLGPVTAIPIRWADISVLAA